MTAKAYTESKQNPFEVLVLRQLHELIRGEESLRTRLDHIKTSNSPFEQTKIAAEVRELERRTDRLYRMLDAMDGHYCAGVAASAEPISA